MHPKHHHEHHKREYIFLASFLLVFGIIFLIGILALKRGIPIIGVMGNYLIEDWVVIGLSFLAVIKVFVEIIKF